MKRREATAKRYARALYLLARESGREEAAGRELQAACDTIFAHRELSDFLLRPWIKGEAKRAAIGAVAERIPCSALVKNFLGLLAARGRGDHLSEIARAHRDLVDEGLGRVRAQVRSAVPLTDADRRALAGRLGRAVGKQVVLEEAVDSALLGGFVAQIGSLVLDGSLHGQLARLRERLVRG
ncbi:MAG: ATP synthase F1 subunit delta [Candidatus Rokubacteria bacterium]|nr:ATP synthase F1 subunit delta [Candidatus Rokubacteria bacterium]